jgi:hypothetical protein
MTGEGHARAHRQKRSRNELSAKHGNAAPDGKPRRFGLEHSTASLERGGPRLCVYDFQVTLLFDC